MSQDKRIMNKEHGTMIREIPDFGQEHKRFQFFKQTGKKVTSTKPET
jgi:hypothetical protein